VARSGRQAPARTRGLSKRATEASLRQRIETLRAENERLREENANLKTELAIAYGRQRSPAAGDSTAVPIHGRLDHDT